VIRCCKIRPNSRCAGSDDYVGYMLARHIKPKKIVFHSRLLPQETCRMITNLTAYRRLGNVKFQRGARDVFSLGHTDEVAQMPKLHSKARKGNPYTFSL
jgi:hypothetical protein